MPRSELEKGLMSEPRDEATHSALDEAEAQVARGEVYTRAEMRESMKQRSRAWSKTQKKVLPA